VIYTTSISYSVNYIIKKNKNEADSVGILEITYLARTNKRFTPTSYSVLSRPSGTLK